MIIDLQPCWMFTNNSLSDQTGHIRQESSEILEAMLDGDEPHALEETIDCLQSCVTMLEIFKRQGFDIDQAIQQVEFKNKCRGYYDAVR